MDQANNQISTEQLVKIINNTTLIGSIIASLAKNDNQTIISAYIKLIAGFLSVYAAIKESKEQQFIPGEVTPLNRLKVGGSIISIIGAIILTYVLLQESSLRAAGITPQSTSISPYITPAFV